MADTISYRFVVKRDLAANFTDKNTLLLQGEFGMETDTKKLKIGDGVTSWTALKYVESGFLLTKLADVNSAAIADGFVPTWDVASGKHVYKRAGSTYQSGTGINIDSTNPDTPIISSTVAAIALKGRVATYSALPSSGNTNGDAWIVDADNLIYIWNGASFPASGSGLSVTSGSLGGGVGPGTDPYIDNVVGLFPLDTRAGSTYVRDLAGSVVYELGSVVGDKVTTRFGKNTLSSTGGGGLFFNTALSMQFIMGSQDFCWEVDFLYTSLSAFQSIISCRPNNGNTAGSLCVGVDNTGAVYCFGPSAFQISPTAAGLSANTWHCVALTCIGNVGRLFVDGVQIGSSFSMPYLTYTASTGRTKIAFGGNLDGTEAFVGNMANARITLGAGRYAANYTPHTAQFPFK